MKRYIPVFILMALASAFFAGCASEQTDEASATVPWGKPASFEGAGVGLPNMSQQE
ncbi:MAG TPA: hypothetical protein PKI32_07360 [Opitutales bacterium]|nr:hypothetical protein [Opitutales bacterium]